MTTEELNELNELMDKHKTYVDERNKEFNKCVNDIRITLATGHVKSYKMMIIFCGIMHVFNFTNLVLSYIKHTNILWVHIILTLVWIGFTVYAIHRYKEAKCELKKLNN